MVEPPATRETTHDERPSDAQDTAERDPAGSRDDAVPPPLRVKDFGAAGPLAVIAMSVPLLGSVALFWVIARTDLGEWLRAQDGFGVALYAAAFALLSGLALMPTYAASAIAGFAFGMTMGSAGAIAGYLGGSLIGYEIGRRTARGSIAAILDARPTWRAVRDALVGGQSLAKTTGIITLLRIPPNSPFALTNLVLASVSAPRVAFVIGTLVGMAPRTVLAVVIGAGLDQLTDTSLKAAGPKWILWVGIAVALVVVVVIGQLATRAVRRVTGAESA